MTAEVPAASAPSLRRRLGDHLGQSQHRNAYCLLANNLLGAATGLLFWILLARGLDLDAREIGVGYALIALGTTIGVVAKGGLDTALLRSLPHVDRAEGARLFRFALLAGTGVALTLALGLMGMSSLLALDESPFGWLLVATIACLLVVTWLQDARFLAMGDAVPSLKRNAVLSFVRLAAPVPVVALALARPVALSWLLALAASALAGFLMARRLSRTTPTPIVPGDATQAPTRARFVATSLRNASSSAAEFLPGLLLAPIVLALAGAKPAAYFAMAWTAASLLFLASSALSRSALAEIVRRPETMPSALRRGILQHLVILAPAAALVIVLAPQLLAFFGPAYAEAGASTLRLLAASMLLVAPGNLYLAVLRARDSPVALAAFPIAMVALLALIAPPMLGVWGLPGVAVAWTVANAPLGILGAWRLRQETAQAKPVPKGEAGSEPAVTGGGP